MLNYYYYYYALLLQRRPSDQLCSSAINLEVLQTTQMCVWDTEGTPRHMDTCRNHVPS